MPVERLRVSAAHVLVLSVCAASLFAYPTIAYAQSAGATPQPTSADMDATLFVQSLPSKNGQEAIQLVWVPEPIEQLCLGKTAQR